VALCRRAICGGGWPSAIVTPARPDLVIVVLRLSCELSPHSLRRTPCSVLTDAGGCSNEAIGCLHSADWTYTAGAFALALRDGSSIARWQCRRWARKELSQERLSVCRRLCKRFGGRYA
jgi:hypothetical protein